MKNNSAQNLNLAELGAKILFFRKIFNFVKSERFDRFFSKLNPKRTETLISV